jgi:Holliday junction resolvasome RuvABC endonuclease subunit
MSSVWLSIDPGLGGTGYAIWETGTPSRHYKKALLYSGQVSCSIGDDSVVARASDIARELVYQIVQNISVDETVSRAYVEEPAYMGGPTARRGDLVKLTLTAGIIVETVREKFKCPINMVRVIDWKGNAPKEIIAKRVCHLMGWSVDSVKKDNHKLDAVGIGLHCLGVFK